MSIPYVDRFLLFACFLLASLASYAEQPLSLAEAISLATQNQPLLQSLDDAAASSRQAAIAEGQLPDPKVKFGSALIEWHSSTGIKRKTKGVVQLAVDKTRGDWTGGFFGCQV